MTESVHGMLANHVARNQPNQGFVGLILRGKILFLPWNGSLLTLPKPDFTHSQVEHEKPRAGFQDQEEGQSSLGREMLAAAEVANLVLMPAPGEQFSLEIKCFDQLLNKVETTVFGQVRCVHLSKV